MAQRRVSDTLIGTTEAGEILGMRPANVAKALERGLHTEWREVVVLVDNKGRVQAQKLLVGGKTQWGYSRDFVETTQRQRASDTQARAIDAKRRAAARARTVVA